MSTTREKRHRQVERGLVDTLFPAMAPTSVSTWRPQAPPDLSGDTEVGFDTETNGLRWWEPSFEVIGVSISWGGGKSRYLPFGHRGGGNLPRDTVVEWLRRELRGKTLRCLNGKFDLHAVATLGIDLEAQDCRISDVGHAAALLDDHRRGFSLDALARDYLGLEKVGQDLAVKRMAEYHASEVAPRAEADALMPVLIWEKQRPLLVEQDLTRVMTLEEDCIYPTAEMERNAAPIDVPKLRAWAARLEQLILRHTRDLCREVGFNIDPGKLDDMARLFRERGIDSRFFTSSGQPSFADDVLAVFEREHPPIAKARLIRKLRSLGTKFIFKYRDTVGDDGLLRYSFHQLMTEEGGTVSGRYSASAIDGVGANPQQVPDPDNQVENLGFDDFIVRELFVAREGKFLAADAEQIEYRLFAHYANNPRIIAAYRENPRLDFHGMVVEWFHQYMPTLLRRPVKNTNFAHIYGAGREKKLAMTGLSEEQLDQLESIYAREIPEVHALIQRAARAASTKGHVRTIMGRRSRFPNHEREHKALNAIIQGGAADYNKKKLVALHRERRQTGFVMRITNHDEVTGDAPDDESARRVAAILDEPETFHDLETGAPFRLRVPVVWKVKTGANWREC